MRSQQKLFVDFHFDLVVLDPVTDSQSKLHIEGSHSDADVFKDSGQLKDKLLALVVLYSQVLVAGQLALAFGEKDKNADGLVTILSVFSKEEKDGEKLLRVLSNFPLVFVIPVKREQAFVEQVKAHLPLVLAFLQKPFRLEMFNKDV